MTFSATPSAKEMADAVRRVVADPTLHSTIRCTQKMLGDIISRSVYLVIVRTIVPYFQIIRPTLTTRMLSRPPMAFLHAVFESVRDTTGFGAGLFVDDESDGNVRCSPPLSRADKIRFLVKLIGCVSIALDDREIEILAVPTRIVSGKDGMAANALLQALARAAMLDTATKTRAVAQTLQYGEIVLYQRAISIRKTIAKCQAVIRGKVERRQRHRCAARRAGLIAPAPAVHAAKYANIGVAAAQPPRQNNMETVPPPLAEVHPVQMLSKKSGVDCTDLTSERVQHSNSNYDSTDATNAAIAANAALDFIHQKIATEELQAACRARMAKLRAKEDHFRVQQSLLDSRYEKVIQREENAKRIRDRAIRDLKKLRPMLVREQEERERLEREQQELEHRQRELEMRQTARIKQKKAKENANRLKGGQPKRAPSSDSTSIVSSSRNSGASMASVGSEYVAAAKRRLRFKRRRDQLLERAYAPPVEEEVTTSSLPAQEDIKRTFEALGGGEGVFGRFLRERMQDDPNISTDQTKAASRQYDIPSPADDRASNNPKALRDSLDSDAATDRSAENDSTNRLAAKTPDFVDSRPPPCMQEDETQKEKCNQPNEAYKEVFATTNHEKTATVRGLPALSPQFSKDTSTEFSQQIKPQPPDQAKDGESRQRQLQATHPVTQSRRLHQGATSNTAKSMHKMDGGTTWLSKFDKDLNSAMKALELAR